MSKLNPVAKLWVQALRSGKWKQTRKQLGRESGSRCCLGVLCDLAVKEGVIEDFNIVTGDLPSKVQEWAGLHTPLGEYFSKRGKLRNLSGDNDTGKRSFKAIADIIESMPMGLFTEKERITK